MESRLPLIEVNIGGKICKALIDTGSSENLTSYEILEKLNLTNCQKESISVNTILGGTFRIKHKTDMCFKIDNQEFKDSFLITQSLLSSHFQMILGVPFIKK